MHIQRFSKIIIAHNFRNIVRGENYIHHALGGINGKYAYVDSTYYMRKLCQRGYKLFEVDVNLTSDDELVLAHRFFKNDYEKRFGIENYSEKGADINGWYSPDSNSYSKYLTYGRFKTCSFMDLVEVMRDFNDVYVMLDIGDSSHEETIKIFELIVHDAKNDPRILNRIIAGGRTKAQVDAQLKVYRFPLINMYYTSDAFGDNKDWINIDDFILYCGSIRAISISTSISQYTPSAAIRLKKAGLLSFVFTTDDAFIEHIIRQFGADVVGTNFLRNAYNERIPAVSYAKEWQNKLYAVSLGTIHSYKATDTEAALFYSYHRGFREFQLDVRMTSDKALVCVDRWHKDTYKTLGIPQKRYDNSYQPALSRDTFGKAKYYGVFPTLTFQKFMKCYSEEEMFADTKCIISIGRPKKEDMQLIINKIINEIVAYGDFLGRFLFRFEQQWDIEMYTSLNCNSNIIYHVVMPEEKSEWMEKITAVLSYCNNARIARISIDAEFYNEKIAELLNERNIKVYVNKCLTVDQVIDAIQLGAYKVGSYDYYL